MLSAPLSKLLPRKHNRILEEYFLKKFRIPFVSLVRILEKNLGETASTNIPPEIFSPNQELQDLINEFVSHLFVCTLQLLLTKDMNYLKLFPQ